MLVKIGIEDLQVNMYVHDIVETPGLRLPRKRAGRVRTPEVVQKFHDIGVQQLIIDIERCGEMPEPERAPTKPMPKDRKAIQSALNFLTGEKADTTRALGNEWFSAKEIFSIATAIVADAFEKIRNENEVEFDQFHQASKAIANSLRRNRDALIWMGKLRNMQRYIYEHSVNCAILTGVFCQSLSKPEAEVEQAIAGALMQNLGEACLPLEIVGKTGNLSKAEVSIVQTHVQYGQEIVASMPEKSPIIDAIVTQHHEQVDGLGYPNGLKADAIDEFAKIAAIVDAYDALSTRKVYREAIPPSQAMKIVLQDCGTRYDEALVHQFIKCMGVYPTGTLVHLKGDRLAVVMEQNAQNSLKPDVKVVFNLKQGAYIHPTMVRLSSPEVSDAIIGYEDPRDHGIDVTEFMPTDEDFHRQERMTLEAEEQARSAESANDYQKSEEGTASS